MTTIMPRRFALLVSIAAALALGVGGCGEGPGTEGPVADRPATDAPASAPRSALAGPTGTIETRVTYAGKPDVKTISINKDVEQCGQTATITTIQVGEDHGLAHAVVSVAGLEGPSTARTPKLDQHGCQFRPHVVGMQPGELEILNSDGILHNIHTYSEANPPINKAQPKFKKVMTETFTKPEFIRVACDVHSWMRGWIAVMPHPYFGITEAGGTARIAEVPVGSHTVEVWHEALGRRTQDVTVKEGETTRLVVSYPAR